MKKPGEVRAEMKAAYLKRIVDPSISSGSGLVPLPPLPAPVQARKRRSDNCDDIDGDDGAMPPAKKLALVDQVIDGDAVVFPPPRFGFQLVVILLVILVVVLFILQPWLYRWRR